MHRMLRKGWQWCLSLPWCTKLPAVRVKPTDKQASVSQGPGSYERGGGHIQPHISPVEGARCPTRLLKISRQANAC